MDIGGPLSIKGQIGRDGDRLPVGEGIAETARLRVPAGETVPFAGETVSGKGLGNAIYEALVTHAACAAVGIKAHGVSVSLPLRIKRQVGVDRDGRAVGIGCTASIGSRIPAGEAMALTGEGVRRQVHRRAKVEFLRVHVASAAVGDECDGVDVGFPLGVKRQVSGNRDGLSIAIGCAGAIGFRIPACEPIALAFKGMSGKGLRDLIGEGLVRHRSRAAVDVKAHRQRDRLPLCVKGHIIDQDNGGIFGKGCAAAVRGGVPAAEGIAHAGELVRGKGSAAATDHLLVIGSFRPAVGFKGDGLGGLFRPDGIKRNGDPVPVRQVADGLPVLIRVTGPVGVGVPADEGEALAGKAERA